MTTRNMRELAFRRLLIREAGTGANAPAIAAAVRRLGEQLTQRTQKRLARTLLLLARDDTPRKTPRALPRIFNRRSRK